MKVEPIIHVIVGAAEWGHDRLRYRRHRLAEFLARQKETKSVIWVCPSPRANDGQMTGISEGIRQFAVKDLFRQKAFRFGRYTDMCYRHKLSPLLAVLKEEGEGARCCLWYTFPGFPLLADLFPWDEVIYDCSDLWAAPISGRSGVLSNVRRNIIKQAEMRIIQRADSITCTSDCLHHEVGKKLENPHQKVFTIENGVEYDLFSRENKQPDEDILRGRNGTVLGFIGGIKPKLDFALMAETADVRPDWTILLVGPNTAQDDPDFKSLLERPNVIWTGPAAPNEVPSYMQLVDIGIMPYKNSPYNDAVFPLKLFEFLAAGKPVVGCNLSSTSKIKRPFVYEYVEGSDPADFIAACDALLAADRSGSYEALRRELARRRDWNVLFGRMLECTGILKNAQSH
ncbi:glycosyltransferase [Bacillus velezensis]|uniref:teichuronic acid biosynthesis protein TuaH n=1 Tax=Bacillus amyloliquefaciens group TaxID=1938374 RepID=UPI00077D7E93|nr:MULTISPECIES: glycosyltransferase [Bacillus amyloliquefaciens group]AMQ69277.1 teichuronic acid biosynthesis glycosyltransferase tuaH [Bacillus amyloliquefaciens UMAF6639]UBQ46030.1 glycosyltransferase [Bacillus velezensis]WGS37682.1 glycosyltransferase [Bacillus velezensis]